MGAVIELPCNIGDPIYRVCFLKDGKGSHICEYKCAGIYITDKVTRWRKEKAVRYLVVRTQEGHAVRIRIDELGETFFVERAEAERRLRNGNEKAIGIREDAVFQFC